MADRTNVDEYERVHGRKWATDTPTRDRLWAEYDLERRRMFPDPGLIAAARKAIEDDIRERVERPWFEAAKAAFWADHVTDEAFERMRQMLIDYEARSLAAQQPAEGGD
jgi:hypothetical protein